MGDNMPPINGLKLLHQIGNDLEWKRLSGVTLLNEVKAPSNFKLRK